MTNKENVQSKRITTSGIYNIESIDKRESKNGNTYLLIKVKDSYNFLYFATAEEIAKFYTEFDNSKDYLIYFEIGMQKGYAWNVSITKIIEQ